MATVKRGGRKNAKRITLQVNATFVDAGDREVRAGAYAFSAGGRLLAMDGLDANGRATLHLEAGAERTAVQLLVGPLMEEEKPALEELLRRGAVGQHLAISATDLKPHAQVAVLPESWLCWFLSRCHVRGRLLKRQEIDGVMVDLPVCNATVTIYEVDPLPYIIERLPDHILDRIKDIVVGPWPPIPEPEPWPPEPEPGPFPGPKPPGPGPDPLPFARREIAREVRISAETATSAITSKKATAAVRSLPAAHPATAITKAVLANPDLIARICPYLPFGIKKDKLGTATTDECGYFTFTFYRGCKNPDTPDLYFTASQNFGPLTLTIYEPKPVACHTHWNYTCGTEVTLYTNHPFARTCSPCAPVVADDNWVLVTAIGNLPLSRIRGTSQALAPSTTSANRGLNWRVGDFSDHDPAVAGSFAGRPFGGTLRLRMEFDNALREDLGVRYYRVSYRRAGSSDPFKALDLEVHRHYTHEVDGELILEGYSLGPKTVGGTANLFEIPPALPPHGQWSFPDLREDLTSAKFATFSLGTDIHGKFELKVDLFDSAGNLVNIDNVGGETIRYVVPKETELATEGAIHTVNATDLGLVTDDDGDGKRSFIMTLHVDNRHCTAAIANPTIDGAGANSCGVLEYDGIGTDTVGMGFTASHPAGFASYTFTLKKGGTLLPAHTMTGQATGTFSTSASAATLLDGCPMAGFSEHLHVDAWATNGWGVLDQLDAGDHRGFALAPKEEE